MHLDYTMACNTKDPHSYCCSSYDNRDCQQMLALRLLLQKAGASTHLACLKNSLPSMRGEAAPLPPPLAATPAAARPAAAASAAATAATPAVSPLLGVEPAPLLLTANLTAPPICVLIPPPPPPSAAAAAAGRCGDIAGPPRCLYGLVGALATAADLIGWKCEAA